MRPVGERPSRFGPLAAAGLLGTLACLPAAARAWGDETHPALVRLAVQSLPDDAAAYFRPLLERIVRHVVEPDTLLREQDGDREGIRHFFNLEAYGRPPFPALPRSQREAERRLGGEPVRRAGLLPWVIVRYERQLREAIREADPARVAREAGYLAHYVADAYQPLHLTVDFDGRGQQGRGFHRRFEDGLVDARIDGFVTAARGQLRPAGVASDRLTAVFEGMRRSHAHVEPLLRADAEARAGAAVESEAYYRALAERVEDVVEEQVARAAWMTGSFWLTAWRQAAPKR